MTPADAVVAACFAPGLVYAVVSYRRRNWRRLSGVITGMLISLYFLYLR
jgi:Na+(H+)/acetate symporter ActP